MLPGSRNSSETAVGSSKGSAVTEGGGGGGGRSLAEPLQPATPAAKPAVNHSAPRRHGRLRPAAVTRKPHRDRRRTPPRCKPAAADRAEIGSRLAEACRRAG